MFQCQFLLNMLQVHIYSVLHISHYLMPDKAADRDRHELCPNYRGTKIQVQALIRRVRTGHTHGGGWDDIF